MRKFLCGVLFVTIVCNTAFAITDTTVIQSRAVPFQYVNDYAHVLKPFEQNILEKRLAEDDNNLNDEIIIITLDSAHLYNLVGMADTFIQKWKVGKNDDGRGVVILADFSTKKISIGISHEMRGKLYDVTCMRLINQLVLPSFKENNYYEGLTNCVQGLEVILSPPIGVQVAEEQIREKKIKEIETGSIIAFIIIVGGIFFFLRKRKAHQTKK
jgi:uncharacterized protein